MFPGFLLQRDPGKKTRKSLMYLQSRVIKFTKKEPVPQGPETGHSKTHQTEYNKPNK